MPWIFSNFSLWGQSVNKDSIIMISKGYHYVIILGIACNFYISIEPVYPVYYSRWTQRSLGYPFSIDPLVHYPRWVLTGHNWNSIYKFCFISTLHLHFISPIKASKYYFVLISLIFIFHIILYIVLLGKAP